MGESSFVVSDIQAGRGCALVDPHGDLAESVLASVPRHRTNDVLLLDAGDRKTVTARLTDPVVQSFWHEEFARWKPQYRSEAIAPIQNKVGQFLSQPILQAIIGQSRSRLDLRRVMDEGQILIANLSKGRIGEDASALLGSLLVTGIQLAAIGRADVPG